MDKIEIKIHPNPANDHITIELGNTIASSSFEIADMKGSLLVKGKIYNQLTLNISNFRPGLYVLQVFNGESTVTRKIVKY